MQQSMATVHDLTSHCHICWSVAVLKWKTHVLKWTAYINGQYYTFTAVEEEELHVTTIYYKVTIQ